MYLQSLIRGDESQGFPFVGEVPEECEQPGVTLYQRSALVDYEVLLNFVWGEESPRTVLSLLLGVVN